MKKTHIQIVVAVMLLLLGCSKDELINDTSENNQLKKGVSGISFYSISVDGDSYSLPDNPITGATRKVLKYGTFEGSIQGLGKIIPGLSPYTFDDLIEEDNGGWSVSYEPKWYIIVSSGIISLSARDYCLVDISGVIITPHFYTAESSANKTAHDGAYINYDGIATTHDGVGKLKGFNKIFKVSRAENYLNCDLSTGQIKLKISEQ